MPPPTVRLHRVPGLSAAVPYAYAATPPPGTTFAFLAGACPLDASGAVVAPGDVAGQARQCVANLRETLAALGVTETALVQTRVLVASADRADLAAAWDVVHDALGDHEAPSTLLGVAALGWPDQLVEVEAVAAVPTEGTTGGQPLP